MFNTTYTPYFTLMFTWYRAFLGLAMWVVVAATGVSAQVAGIEMRGNLSFSEQGEDLRFTVDEVINTRSSGTTSGKLRLALWLTDAPYAGGLLRGTELADLELAGLEGGKRHLGIDAIAKLQRAPRKGSYYPVFVLFEEVGRRDEQMVDWVPFSNPVNFGGVSFIGTATIQQLSQSHLRFNLQGVSSARLSGNISHPLQVVLLGYKTPTPGPLDLPRLLSFSELPSISPGGTLSDISAEGIFLFPSDGTYYLFLALEEFYFGHWVEGDRLAFAEPLILSTPTPELSIQQATPSTIRIKWDAEVGYRYTLQSSFDMKNWTTLGDSISVRSGDPTHLTRVASTLGETQFFRVLVTRLIL